MYCDLCSKVSKIDRCTARNFTVIGFVVTYMNKFFKYRQPNYNLKGLTHKYRTPSYGPRSRYRRSSLHTKDKRSLFSSANSTDHKVGPHFLRQNEPRQPHCNLHNVNNGCTSNRKRKLPFAEKKIEKKGSFLIELFE